MQAYLPIAATIRMPSIPAFWWHRSCAFVATNLVNSFVPLPQPGRVVCHWQPVACMHACLCISSCALQCSVISVLGYMLRPVYACCTCHAVCVLACATTSTAVPISTTSGALFPIQTVWLPSWQRHRVQYAGSAGHGWPPVAWPSFWVGWSPSFAIRVKSRILPQSSKVTICSFAVFLPVGNCMFGLVSGSLPCWLLQHMAACLHCCCPAHGLTADSVSCIKCCAQGVLVSGSDLGQLVALHMQPCSPWVIHRPRWHLSTLCKQQDAPVIPANSERASSQCLANTQRRGLVALLLALSLLSYETGPAETEGMCTCPLLT